MLGGVTVLDLSSVGPAARASRWLADYGATVVKVGPVPARESVQISPPSHAYSGHRFMKRALVDLKAPDGRGTFLKLAEGSDVIIESFRPGVADRLGIGYADVRGVNGAIVYCSTTGYGPGGPRASWAGHDLNYLAVSGFLDCTEPDAGSGKPPIPGTTLADSAGGGMQAVIAILAALVHRSSTGEGAKLDVSVADGMLSLMALQIDEYLSTGEAPGPGRGILSGRYACYDLYQAGDGRWLSVAAIEERFWENLCRALGLDRWAAHQTDDTVQPQVREDLRRVFSTKSRDEWVEDLAPKDTCVAPVLSVPELAGDSRYGSRALVTAELPQGGHLRQVGATMAGMPPPREPVLLRAAGSTDTDELLRAAGVPPDTCAQLREMGVVA